MKEGKIIEKGTHKELLEMNGYYAGLIRDQLAADEIRQLNEKNISLNISMSFSYDCFDNENDIDDEDDAIKVDEPLINRKKENMEFYFRSQTRHYNWYYRWTNIWRIISFCWPYVR